MLQPERVLGDQRCELKRQFWRQADPGGGLAEVDAHDALLLADRDLEAALVVGVETPMREVAGRAGRVAHCSRHSAKRARLAALATVAGVETGLRRGWPS